MLERRSFGLSLVGSVLVTLVAACGDSDDSGAPATGPETIPHTLYVAHDGVLTAYDIATGTELEGSVAALDKPNYMQVLDDGTVMVNNPPNDEILVAKGRPVREVKRIPSSSQGGTNPVDSYISPEYDGKKYWLSLNDGSQTAGTTTGIFVDITPDSPTWLQPLGEMPVSFGHHQASFSTTQQRVVVSNFFDCDNVLSVYDFSDVKNIKTLETLTAAEAGMDGSTMAKTCDASGSAGVAMLPHGCATSKLTGKAFCNITGPGLIAVIDIDADPPTFKIIPTTGTGSGNTRAAKGGKYIYAVQGTPREGQGGPSCQIGQLVTIDAESELIASETPLFYKGPGCTDVLVGTDEETANPNRIRISLDGKTMFIAVSGAYMLATGRVRQHLVLDLSDPSSPVQLPSIPVGTSTSDRATEISGDGKFLFVADPIDGTVTQIDVATRAVTRTLKVRDMPLMVATYGTAEGPSLQQGPIE
jgi:YVTN family beta-propeller protein